MPERPPPPDQHHRHAIERRLDDTLFVEAGAGSGKTTALVKRVMALVTDGGAAGEPVPLSAVAAITFTEKAGAELRERLRETLERALEREATAPAAPRWQQALDDLDGAAIGTLHSFAQRILSEHPIEAGLPPRLEVLDEVTSGVAFSRRWSRFSEELYADAAYERTLLLLSAAGVRDATPRALARSFNANWDLVAELVPEHCDPPAPVGERIDAVLAAVEAACAPADHCTDAEDKLLARLGEIAAWVARVRAQPDEVGRLEALGGDRPSFKVRLGRKGSWTCDIDEVRDAVRASEGALEALLATVAAECAHHLGSALRRFTLGSAEARRRAGTLEFHDLLVLARAVLRDEVHGAAVRTALHDRYRRLLLDEFQDTDPIQIELAVRIAAADPGSTEAGTARWEEVEVAPGRLFVVGDPKQSIYRFRRADIRLFLEASRRLGPDDPGQAVTLTTNFRTVEPVIDWVNTTFDRLMAPEPTATVRDSQPSYTALTAQRPEPPVGPAVAVLGATAHPSGTRVGEIRAAEAADVVAVAQQALATGWSIGDGDGGWRPPTLGDITVLVPARTSLPYLEDALDAAGISFRAESSSLVYATRAVRDLLMVVRAVAEPAEHLYVVSALRTPLFGCGDDDLHRFKAELGGHWSYRAPQPDSVPADDPVHQALAVLARWEVERAWTSPSELLERIAEERRAFELAFAEGRPRDVWRRLRWLIDQARAWTDATGGDLRAYLAWVDQQTVDGARVSEAVLPETDDDAVRIMTIHAAKGLEFPITIVSGLSSRPGGGVRAGTARFTPGEPVAYYLGKGAETPEFTAAKPIDEQMDLDERIRLLYVATTRARDHLVVSAHRAERRSAPAPAARTNAELLVDGMGALIERCAWEPEGDSVAPARPPAAPPKAPEPYDQWQEAHARALAAAQRPSTIAATALTDEGRPDVVGPDGETPRDGDTPRDADTPLDADSPRDADTPRDGDSPLDADEDGLDRRADGADPGLRKRPGDLDRPPWLKGRYGTAVGRAVHGTLQTIDLASAPDAPAVLAAVAAQAQAEAVPDRAAVVAELVAHALGAPSVVEAATAPHWREVYVSTPVEGTGRLLEGYVDLLYRRAGAGLVVVDHKTAATTDPAELDRRVEGYRAQGAAYALAVGRATGEAVVEVVFLFLTPDGAVERRLDDLAAAVAEVERQLSEGGLVEVG